MHAALIVAGGVLVAFACLLVLLLPAKLRAIKERADLVSTCGYLPPQPTVRAQSEMDAAARFFICTNVGRVEIEGAQHLSAPSPKMLVFNHSSTFDAFVIPYLVHAYLPDWQTHPARYMTGRGNFKALSGTIGLLIARWGGFSADTRRGMGGAAVEVAVKVVASGQLLVMSPEGRTDLTGNLGAFMPGAVRIAHKAAEAMGQPLTIICAHLHYGRYAPSWLQRMPEGYAYLLQIFAFWYFRAGVKVVLRSISSADLPADEHAATDLLRSTLSQMEK